MQPDFDLTPILSHWFDTPRFSALHIAKGTSSHSCKITTPSGTYVLRQLPSPAAARQEYAVTQLLCGTGLSADIVLTIHGEPFAAVQDRTYQLQSFLPGQAPNLSEKSAVLAAARALATMQSRFSGCNLAVTTANRFDTMSLWDLAAPQSALLSPFFAPGSTPEEMRAHILTVETALDSGQIIHGDLGNWNMLWDGTHIFFIDFTECHLGDFYTDIAAVSASILRAAPDSETLAENLTLFQNTYAHFFRPIDTAKLRGALWLWLLRGAMAACIYLQDAGQKEHALRQFVSDWQKYETI